MHEHANVNVAIYALLWFWNGHILHDTHVAIYCLYQWWLERNESNGWWIFQIPEDNDHSVWVLSFLIIITVDCFVITQRHIDTHTLLTQSFGKRESIPPVQCLDYLPPFGLSNMYCMQLCRSARINKYEYACMYIMHVCMHAWMYVVCIIYVRECHAFAGQGLDSTPKRRYITAALINRQLAINQRST